MAAPTSGNAIIVAGIGGAATLVLAAALAAYLPELVPWTIGGLALCYGVGLPVHAGSVGQAAAYGIGLLLVAECAYWSLDESTTVPGEPGTRRRRIALLLGVLAATLVLDQVALGAASLSAGGELLLAAGVVAVVAVAALAAGLVTALGAVFGTSAGGGPGDRPDDE